MYDTIVSVGQPIGGTGWWRRVQSVFRVRVEKGEEGLHLCHVFN